MKLWHLIQKRISRTADHWRSSLEKRIPCLRRSRSTQNSILFRLTGRRGPQDGTEPRVIEIGAMLTRHGITPRGVIHVGAHTASELDDYLRMGFNKILYIEANPALILDLQTKASAYPGTVFIVHAAASDRNGTVLLRRTSMDQSSSILPLGKHTEIYPSIHEVDRVEVPERRLDTILSEAAFQADDFNVLNLDIQGAELKALRGAPNLLQCIEGINTEVNLIELYEGAPLIAELEAYLALQGFGRTDLKRPWHPSWGDAFYVRKPVVSMSTLGRNGRFANQLFQYMFLKLVARKQDAIVQTGPWQGQELFGLEDPEPMMKFREWREPVDELSETGDFKSCEWTRHFSERDDNFDSRDYWGYFQGHTVDLVPYRDFIRGTFRFTPKIAAELECRLGQLRGRRPRILAVHLRRGDYGYGHFFRAPCSWYERWLQESALDPAEWLVYICSEQPEDYRDRFAGFQTADASALGVGADVALFADFYVLTQADRVLISNSSFSFAASMLNERALGFERPCSRAERLQSFDPWDAPVLLRHAPDAATHARFRAED